MGQPEENKRSEFRFPVRFRVEASQNRRPLDSRALRDISTAGLRIHSGEAVSKGQAVEVRFPDIDPSFVARGQVIWCSKRETKGFDIGVRFSDSGTSEYERMCTRIREIETFRRTVEDLRGSEFAPEDAARQWLSKFSTSVG